MGRSFPSRPGDRTRRKERLPSERGNVDPAGSVYSDSWRLSSAHTPRSFERGEEVHPRGGAAGRRADPGRGGHDLPRCAGARRVRAGRHPQRRPPAPGPPGVPGRGQAARQGRPRRRLLRRRRALGLRGQDPRRARLHRRAVADRRLQQVEGRRPALGRAAGPDPGPAQPLPAPPAPARDRRDGPAQAARLQGAAARRRRTGLARRPVPGRRRRGHPGHHRHGRGRRVEPAAPDPAQHGPGRGPQGRLGQEDADRAEPRRQRGHL